MDKPKAMQNIRIGVDVSSDPVGVNDSRPDRWPSWKIHTMAPNVAVRLSRLSTSALSGITTLPVNRNSTTNVMRLMMASAIGSREAIEALESTSCAERPVTSTRKGADVLRTSCTRCSPWAETGSTLGTTDSHVPCGLAKRWDAGLAPMIWWPPMYDPVRLSTRETPDSLESCTEYWSMAASRAGVAGATGATTDSGADSLEEKPWRMSSCTWRLLADVGSTRSSGRPNFTWMNGSPSRTSSTTMEPPIASGRRMTARAMRCHPPWPTGLGWWCQSTHLSMRGPNAARA